MQVDIDYVAFWLIVVAIPVYGLIRLKRLRCNLPKYPDAWWRSTRRVLMDVASGISVTEWRLRHGTRVISIFWTRRLSRVEQVQRVTVN